MYVCIALNFTALKSFNFHGPDSIPQFTDTDIRPSNTENQYSAPVSFMPVDCGTRSRKRPASSGQSGSHKYLKPSSVNAEFLDMKVP